MDTSNKYCKNSLTRPQNNKTFYGPSKIDRPDYGAKVQYVKHDRTWPLGKKQVNYLERVVGIFSYYARAIDNTKLHALYDIATATSKGTEATLK